MHQATGVLYSGAWHSLSRHPVARVTFLLKVSACIITLTPDKCEKLRYLDVALAYLEARKNCDI